jgi:ubiquitin carboxyl-terminal hydrolase 8
MGTAAPSRVPNVEGGYSYLNGFAQTNGTFSTHSNRKSWAGSQGSADSTDGQNPIQPKYPHLKDLEEKARIEQKVTINSSINVLIERADQCAKQAQTDITFKRPDRAYVEWLISSHILSTLIPNHKGYPDLNTSRGVLLNRYRTLIKQNNAQHGLFKEIHGMVVEDNQRSGIKPSLLRPPSSPDLRLGGFAVQPQSPRPVSMPDTADLYDGRKASRGFVEQWNSDPPQGSSLTRRGSQQSRERPTIREKPDRLYAGPLLTSVNGHSTQPSSDVLTQRFAQLRPSKNNTQSPPPYPGDESKFSSVSTNDSKPSGPRPMPNGPLPPLPPKLPLKHQPATSLPRAPSPTYNPTRNIQTLPSNSPPRDLPRTMSSSSTKSLASNTNSSTFTSYSTRGEDVYNSNGMSHPSSLIPARNRFQELPNPFVISASELYDRLRSSRILLIDVRTREAFDEGHIHSSSIICIEPLSLRTGLSAEDLEDSLIVSPESEELLFKRRDEFDLIVYYDQATKSNHFLEGPPNQSSAPALRALHESLWEFNYNRRLQRPPAVLHGGLEAWIDHVGPLALLTSQTAAPMGLKRTKRPANGVLSRGRASTITYNASREVQRRRLREYDPLDAEEEKKWLETAKQEEVEPADYQGQSDGDNDSIADEPPSPLIHSYEDFLRKFPEAHSIQQSMKDFRQPIRPAPVIPSIPSRPPPAVPRPSYSGVSDRNVSQVSPPSRQPPSVQTPLYTSRTITHYLKLPRTGLINFSVTCYMNATIQCLLATIPLSQFFLDNRWRDFTQRNWKGSNGIMPEIYANLIRSLWKNDVQAIRPTSLRSFCTRLNREWGLDRQQDAKEFLEFIIDCLHEDLNVNWNRRPLEPLTPSQEAVRERMPVAQVSRTEWDRYSHRETSFISDLFAGQHASRLRCKTCGSTSTTYEAFYSISVEIPRSGRGDIKECLRSYCQEEMLSGDEVWKCPHCRCEREATKRITLTRLPKILVIHFKRFSASKTESARKIHTPIDFPLHGLSMEPYMANTQFPPPPGQEAFPDPATTPPFMYDAYAVMRHLGQTGSGGHYISLVRDRARGCWRKFDDEKATDFDPRGLRADQALQNGQAYIVFYERSAAR